MRHATGMYSRAGGRVAVYWRMASALMAASLLSVLLALPAEAAGKRAHRFIVRMQADGDIVRLAVGHGARLLRQITGDDAFLLEKETDDSSAFVQTLQSSPGVVEAAAEDVVVIPELPTSQLTFAFDLGPDPMGYWNQTALLQVNLGSAHASAIGRGVRVAVLDTGVNANHSDLVGRCVAGYNAIDPSLPPDDVPALPDAEISIFGQRDSGAGHGTMIAGIIALVAPGAEIMPVKVLSADGTGREADVVEGIRWAIRNGADVINMSFGSPSASRAVARAILAARVSGAVLVASAGNDSSDAPHSPAALHGVLSVTSVEEDNVKSPWASYGSTVDLVCPGSGIRSAYWDGGYATWSGTSFAAAFVSGAAALVRELRPHGAGNRVKNVLTRTATSVDDLNPDYAGLLGRGLLNIEAAVSKAR